jgi:hypothetical protein
MKNIQSSLQKESHNQYRNRVGRTSRHQHLMSRGVDSSNRREEIKRFSEDSARIEKKVQVEIADIVQSTTISRQMQKHISYDKPQSPVINSRAHHSRKPIEVSA